MQAFYQLHPVTAAVYFAAVLGFSMFLRNPLLAVFSLTGAAAFCSFLTDAAEKRSDLRFHLPFICFVTLVNPLFSHNGRTPLFFLNGNAVTVEAICYGVYLGVMLSGVLLWCKALSKVIDADKLLYLLGKLSPSVALVMSAVMRYLPALRREAESLRQTQAAMGLFSSESLTDRLAGSLKIYGAMLIRLPELAAAGGQTMRARGFGEAKRRYYTIFRFRRRDAAVLLLTLLGMAAVICFAATAQYTYTFYPSMTGLSFGAAQIPAYACFFGLTLLPFFAELEEAIRWRRYRSGI